MVSTVTSFFSRKSFNSRLVTISHKVYARDVLWFFVDWMSLVKECVLVLAIDGICVDHISCIQAWVSFICMTAFDLLYKLNECSCVQQFSSEKVFPEESDVKRKSIKNLHKINVKRFTMLVRFEQLFRRSFILSWYNSFSHASLFRIPHSYFVDSMCIWHYFYSRQFHLIMSEHYNEQMLTFLSLMCLVPVCLCANNT